jgi:Tfp pilus assembly protein PilN
VRAVNLIPPEARGERRPTRTGSLAYIVIGGLVLALAGVTAVVMIGNAVSDKQSEIASLQARQTELQGQIAKVQSYSDLATLEQNRVATVTSLAQSRFDWSRALRELALVIPNDVWLTSLSGSVAPEVTTTGDSGAASSLRDQVAGPALSMEGCAAGHDSVAAFLDVLRDIDGVTRVAVTSSDRGSSGGSSAGGTSSAGTSSCEVRNFISRFDIIVAFDPVATPASIPAVPSTATPAAATTGADGGVAGAQSQEQQAGDSINQQTTKAHNAVNAITPGAVGG